MFNACRLFVRRSLIGNYNELKESVDFTNWLEYFADGILDELLRVNGELATMTSSPETSLQPYHDAILRHIDEHGFITDREYSGITDRAKATRALAKAARGPQVSKTVVCPDFRAICAASRTIS